MRFPVIARKFPVPLKNSLFHCVGNLPKNCYYISSLHDDGWPESLDFNEIPCSFPVKQGICLPESERRVRCRLSAPPPSLVDFHLSRGWRQNLRVFRGLADNISGIHGWETPKTPNCRPNPGIVSVAGIQRHNLASCCADCGMNFTPIPGTAFARPMTPADQASVSSLRPSVGSIVVRQKLSRRHPQVPLDGDGR